MNLEKLLNRRGRKGIQMLDVESAFSRWVTQHKPMPCFCELGEMPPIPAYPVSSASSASSAVNCC